MKHARELKQQNGHRHKAVPKTKSVHQINSEPRKGCQQQSDSSSEDDNFASHFANKPPHQNKDKCCNCKHVKRLFIENNPDSPSIKLKVCGRKCKHILDTGTTINIMNYETFIKLPDRPILKETKIKAYGYNSIQQILKTGCS
jgi:hypothetical protein